MNYPLLDRPVLRWAAFCIALIGATLIALAPNQTLANLHIPLLGYVPDTAMHILGFFILGVTAWFSHAKGPWLLGGLTIFSIFLELMQTWLHTGRGASFWDALANAIGLGLAVLVGLAIELRHNNRTARPSA